MKPKLLALLSFCAGIAVEAQAGVAGWTVAASVAALEANDIGRFAVKLAIEKNTSGCRDPNWFYGDYGRAGSDLMYQTLLDASRLDLKVQLYATGVCDLNGYSGISAVRILP